MYNFYQNNQLHGGEGKFEIGLYESFDFDAFGVSPYIYQMWFTLHEQGKILTFYYNTEERNEGMIYNMGQFLDLVEDLYLSNVSQPIHLPLCDFWMKVMFDFSDHLVWAKMWSDLEISPSDSEDEEFSEVEVSDEESEGEVDEEDGEWLESGDEDWVPESEEDENDEEESDEEDEEDEEEDEEESEEESRMTRQEEKNAFFLRNITYRAEERKMRCHFCGSRARKTKEHIQSDRHRACVSTQLGGNKWMFF